MAYKFSSKLAVVAAAISLSGCITTGEEVTSLCFTNSGEVVECRNLGTAPVTPVVEGAENAMHLVQDPTLFRSDLTFVGLDEYVEQLAVDLSTFIRNKQISSVAVASFVELDSSLQSTSTIGNQISEYFVNELVQAGIKAHDYKVTGGIKVTAFGDFAMSRNFMNLNQAQDIKYVLAGTLLRNSRGIVVNARIVSLTNNGVVASSSKLIPNLIASQY